MQEVHKVVEPERRRQLDLFQDLLRLDLFRLRRRLLSLSLRQECLFLFPLDLPRFEHARFFRAGRSNTPRFTPTATATFAFEPPTPLSVVLDLTPDKRRIEPERDGRPCEPVRLRFPLGFVRVDATQAVVFALLSVLSLRGDRYAGSWTGAVLSAAAAGSADIVSTGRSRAAVGR